MSERSAGLASQSFSRCKIQPFEDAAVGRIQRGLLEFTEFKDGDINTDAVHHEAGERNGAFAAARVAVVAICLLITNAAVMQKKLERFSLFAESMELHVMGLSDGAADDGAYESRLESFQQLHGVHGGLA